MSIQEQRRERFEQAVIDLLKESGFLEIEVRAECLGRNGDGYFDGSIDTYWHFWSAALDSIVIEMPDPADYDDSFLAAGLIDKVANGVKAAGLKVKP